MIPWSLTRRLSRILTLKWPPSQQWRTPSPWERVEETFLVKTSRTYFLVTYSTLKAVFSLRRMSAFYVNTVMVPLTMLAVTSIITLWMSPDKNNLKIGLNILLLLAASFKAENINNSLPFSYYTKASPTLLSILLNIISFRYLMSPSRQSTSTPASLSCSSSSPSWCPRSACRPRERRWRRGRGEGCQDSCLGRGQGRSRS